MRDYQRRVVVEKRALDSRLAKLSAFIESRERFHQLPDAECLRMVRQQVAMQRYSDILGERIAAFEPDTRPPRCNKRYGVIVLEPTGEKP